jgi:hypothetical protein
VITLDLARRLRRAGVPWTPGPGDRFVVPDRDMDDEVFVVSDMVVEVHELPTGRLLGFNGTTEWALDSIMARDVVWLPREDQLRELLGGAFVSLEARPGGFVVTVERDVRQERHIDIDAECAYARAVLAGCEDGPVAHDQ